MAFENYRQNLDLVNKFNCDAIKVSKSMICCKIDLALKRKHTEPIESEIPPLASAVIGLNNTVAAQYPKNPKKPIHTWTDLDTQQLYLNTKPTCYLILSKPGTGAYSLGEAISKKFNCVHLCPLNILIDEMEQNSDTGKCIDFNMRHNSVIKVNHILPILKKKVQSPAVQHRGYVLSGLPLVTTNRKPTCLFYTLHGEESVLTIDELLFDLIYNLKKKKRSRKKTETESAASLSSAPDNPEEGQDMEEEEEEQPEEAAEEGEEEEDQAVELPKYLLETCNDIIHPRKTYVDTEQGVLIRQFNELFNLGMEPDEIIYISCPDTDLITKKHHKYINYKSGLNNVDPFTTKDESELRWPPKYTMSDYASPFDSLVFNSKYNCRQPINYTEPSIEQMCNYRNYLSSFIGTKLQDFHPKQIIRLDGRTSVHQMIYHIAEILHETHSVRPVIIPEPLYLEEPPEDIEEYWKTVEDLNVIRSGVVKFNHYPSPWFNRCPVELKKRRSLWGKPKFSATFFNRVYLLSSLNALIAFCRNPRPYLDILYLEPTCRVIVIGTKSSGKTMICECLSWIFDAPIVSFTKLMETEKQKKYNSFSRTILSEIIATIEDERLAQWQNTEMERERMLSDWQNSTMNDLKKYIPLLIEYIKMTERKQPKLKVEKDGTETLVETKEDKAEAAQNDKFIKSFNICKRKLAFLPFLDNLEWCKRVFAQNDIMQYAPVKLFQATEKPAIPALGDEDVTKAILNYIEANDLQKEIEPAPEEVMNMVINKITEIDTEVQDSSNGEILYGKYVIDGFASDPEYWGYLNDSKLLPDHTIVLMENREVEPDLIEYYKTIDSIPKNHQKRFILANDPLIKIKSMTKKIEENDYIDVKNIVHQSIERTLDVIFQDRHETEDETEVLAAFNQSVDKFREDWDSVKLTLEESKKSFIEVELETKSDIQIVEEVLIKLRQSYWMPCTSNEGEEFEDIDEEDESPKNVLTYNDPRFLGDTNVYCPIAFYEYGVLWEGKSEFSVKYDNKFHYFSNEESFELFRKDFTKYLSYNKPCIKVPPLRICFMGCIGSGRTTISQNIAKELGLMCIDFNEIINMYLMPRHFKKVGLQYENKFTDISLDEEAVTEFQMGEENENLISDIMSNETELRRMVFNYFERGIPLLSQLLQKLLKKLWFEEPFSRIGFVLDGFPRLPTDIEDMTATYCIPDLIIELECNSEAALERLSPKFFKTWKMQQNEAKDKVKQKLKTSKQEWMDYVTKNVVCKLICDEIIKKAESFIVADEPAEAPSNESVRMDANPDGLADIDDDLYNTYNEFVQENPQPTDETEWENADDARERIDSRLESIYESDDENIQALKEILSEQKIKATSLDATKSLTKVTRVALLKLSNLRNRCESMFEQVFVLSCDIAEMLLLEGFYFLSQFHRMCPVYIYENPNTILNPYRTSKLKGTIFPVIHRSHIYFINGEESLIKFRFDPLKYIMSDNILSYHKYSLRIGIIGPPKSGKSELAARLAKQFGLMCLSRGMAVRNVLEKMHWTKLASKMTSTLETGECLGTDLIFKAVQTALIDPRVATDGFVFDGFPDSPSEVMELSKEGIYPLIMFDLTTKKDVIMENSQNEIYFDIIKRLPPYSRPFIEYRFNKWNEQYLRIRNHIKNDFQNLYFLNGSESRWQCLQDSKNVITGICPKIHYYVTNVKSKIVPVDVMCISNEIFQQRMSCFKHMCPVCICSNTLRHSGFPVDRKGVVQYNGLFYWICADHMDKVLKDPESHLSAYSVDIPEIPVPVKNVNVPLVYEKGICMVTYAENLPSQKIARGVNNFAASYRGKTYLFCSETCLKKFLAKPHMYYDITIFKETRLFPKISLNKLPDIGYLEQTVGNILTEACCAVNVLRPKYPGLDIKLSALLFIALYLKTNNARMDSEIQALFVKALKVYEARSKLILELGLRLRSMDNPFAKYPKCCHGAMNSDSGTVSSRVPVPDERFDYLCEYHKPVSKVPAFLNVVDIAGLVRGAAEGQGLGNAFLSHIKACDAIFNLCRAFDDEDVIHVDGDVNPVRDLETIGEELRLKDEEQLMQHVDKLDRVVNRGGDKKLKPEHDSLMKIKNILVEEKKHIRFGDWSAADIEVINKYLFLTSKPALYLVNLSEKDYIRKKNKWLPKLKEWIDKNDPGAPLIPFSGVLESKLMDMEPEERKSFLKEQGITSALDKIIVQGYKALQLEYFFTAGPDEVKAWTIQRGTKAPQAAGRIHTDFEKGFIMAEVMHFKDFKEEGTEAACKAAGKYRQQGRNYVVEDGDIIFFKFNAGAGLKDAKKK